jgi:hypothetical protein
MEHVSLQDQLESLFDTVWCCEREWRLDDRLALLLSDAARRERR